jgi:hypothetical protein
MFESDDCSGRRHNDVFWADGVCWNESSEDGGGSALSYCQYNSFGSYVAPECSYANGYSYYEVTSIPGYASCSKSGQYSSRVICGGGSN